MERPILRSNGRQDFSRLAGLPRNLKSASQCTRVTLKMSVKYAGPLLQGRVLKGLTWRLQGCTKLSNLNEVKWQGLRFRVYNIQPVAAGRRSVLKNNVRLDPKAERVTGAQHQTHGPLVERPLRRKHITLLHGGPQALSTKHHCQRKSRA